MSTPPAMSLDAVVLGDPRFKFKAAIVGHLNAFGIRLLARFSGQTGDDARNQVAVYHHEPNDVLVWLISERWLSRIRIAAFDIAALETLLPDRPLTVGLFGADDIADEMVPLLGRSFRIEKRKVLSRTREMTVRFVEPHSRSFGDRIHVANTAEDVVRGSDLVISLTESREPLVRPGSLGTKAVLCSMGSYNEIAFDVLAEVDRLVVDDPDYASEMGDGGAWIRRGNLSHEAFNSHIDALACTLAAGFRQDVRSDGRRTIALVQGMAIGDVTLAAYAIRRFQAPLARQA